jgi:hypothetical protein
LHGYDSINVGVVCFSGDFCLAGEIAEFIALNRINNSWSPLKLIFGNNVSIVTNLEAPFTSQPSGLPYKWANLKSSPELNWVLDGLSMAVISNNHIADFGSGGVNDTLELLKNKGIQAVGYGCTLSDALQPAFLQIGQQTLGVVSLCCPTTNSENLATHLTPGVAPLGMQTLKQAIDLARPQCDALAVYLHWGCEWVHDPAPDQLRLARHAIDCGADAVIGCHSHTIQSYEQYRGRWIFYGLGNYLFRAGYAQRIKENGNIEQVPLRLERSNRESLAVSFRIVPDTGSGRFALDRVQPMFFGDDWTPRPISEKDLSFDLEGCNNRLHEYVTRNVVALRDRSEPVLRAQLRNGVLAYWYGDESIVHFFRPQKTSLFGMTVRRAKQIVSAVVSR